MWKKFLIFAIALVGCASGPKEGELVVGLQSGYPPYEYVAENGQVVGFDVEVAQKLADSMGKKLVVQEMGFDSLILALKGHRIDLIMSGMSITEERQKEIDFVSYTGARSEKMQLLFWNQIGSSLEELRGKEIAVQSGTLQAELLQEYTTPKEFENIQELVIDIKYGKSVAALVEVAVAGDLRQKYPQLHIVDVPLKKPLLGNGIGIAKDSAALKAAVENEVQRLKASGEMEILEKKWFNN